ncbi:hypothetical protein [Wolbachia endosymbiont of Ctenocephalides felis wCfeJ]|uniref:hypothetical protein n=1 Tax=Wolbachia endosymbiont of Ctenocephalides felis wCfeJ TaxID=2732594 RepID=UPI001FE8E176|nr:hypothetical protein [Wolbachia endosymbiont of Ctenocephalides felis wCfeJ]
MEKYTFKIDNKNLLHKKLLKLPTQYFKLSSDDDGYTLYSHNGTSKVRDFHSMKLKWENNQIVLKVKEKDGGEKDYIMEQEAIIDRNRNDTISKLQTQGTMHTVVGIFESLPGDKVNYCIRFYDNIKDRNFGVLNFINFNDENDPVLQHIKSKKGALYFTIEGDSIYMSDKDGKCLQEDICYQYQYTKNPCDVLEISDISTIIDSLEPKFALQKGEELQGNTYKANIALNDEVIATLPKIGYYMLDDQLVIRNHVTQETVVIPSDFHYLKVIKFGDNDYKLTFCNVLGNEFFEYKKYDPQYSSISDEYKFISLSCTKKEYNPSLGELLSHRPSFFIAEGSLELGSDSEKYAAAVFELTPAGKGRQMATLIDEFGYFNQDDMFMHCNYHTGSEYQIYDPAEIDKEYKITDADNEFYLTK